MVVETSLWPRSSWTVRSRAYVVCRFLLSGVLLIITAYTAEEE